MKVFFLSFYFLVSTTCPFAQPAQKVTSTNEAKGSGNVYALVIGISKYLQSDIPQLQFADRDATVFADYLKSKAGGSVPADNIRLLVNEQATTSAVYDAIYWLKTTCQKDDLVFFYFSGHGDLENITMYNNGFLICYDSPPNNYVKLALSIDYLNDIANTLSAQTKANVVLITDACHSGKLAGSKYKGNYLVGEQLRAVKDKEIRLTSCDTNQLSNEMAEWGGGRGVFSYYLINGLKGLGDREKDGTVTLDEIKHYLDTSLAQDAVLRRQNIVQTPVVKGRGNFVLAKVDQPALMAAEREVATTDSMQFTNSFVSAPVLKEIQVDSKTYFFDALKEENLEEITNYLSLDSMSADYIPFAIIDQLKGRLKTEAERTTILDLEKTLRESKEALKRFNGRLAVAFDEKGQQVIDQYLAGDEAELERRRYYNIKNNGYDVYPRMLDVALKLTQPDNYLHGILEVKKHYFAGVAARLKIPTVEDQEPLIKEALSEQKKALALEEHAAYIYNELGILSNYKKDYTAAEKYYLRATEIAPEWSIPWSNLAGLYAYKGNLEKGFAAVVKAKDIQPGLQNIYVNSGILYEKKGNLLMAEELMRKSIYINSRHYLPFERLGYIYMNTTSYALADSFFFEAALRKKGYHFPEVTPNSASGILDPLVFPYFNCSFDTLSIGKHDAMGHLVWGNELLNTDTNGAEKHYKIAIGADKYNPLAFHYLAVLLYNQKRWQEAEIIFKMAMTTYLDSTKFTRYCDSIRSISPKSRSCIINLFEHAQYDKLEDFFLLADLYEQWNHFDDAVTVYRNLIQLNSDYKGGYQKLWQLLEKTNRYKDAEQVLLQYYLTVNEKLGRNELNGFYKRMMVREPENGAWFYTAGIFLYHLAEAKPNDFPYDKKEILPDTYTVQLVGWQNRGVNVQPSTRLPGTGEQISGADEVEFPKSEGLNYLLKADSLAMPDDNITADIRYKIGDLYVWLGLPEKASPYYKRASDLKPDNANIRMKLIDTYASAYLLQDALGELEYLHWQKEINFPKQLLLARYYVHAGRFESADTLLNSAQKVYPYLYPQLTDLKGRLQLLKRQYQKASGFYWQSSEADKRDSLSMYNLARLYAKLGNNKEAWQWLERSLVAGFDYSYVLKYDPFFERLRSSGKWNTLISRFHLKEYAKPAIQN